MPALCLDILEFILVHEVLEFLIQSLQHLVAHHVCDFMLLSDAVFLPSWPSLVESIHHALGFLA
jgi:hypothetical protein